MTNPMIVIKDLTKRFGTTVALDKISAEIGEGEFFSLLGPSGCGKTTLLRTIAGFGEPDGGSIYIDGQTMAGVEANRRPTNMVFQNYAVFPHMAVWENVAFGLRRRRLARREMENLVDEALSMVGLDGFGAREPHSLSGGQRQRVALARALVLRPKVLLLDEPLSALDKQLREQMQSELRHLQRAVGITFVLVTHDQEEALNMSDRIAVMFDGRIVQQSTPQDIYMKPVTRQVAEFIGLMNFLGVCVKSETPAGYRVDVAGLGEVDIERGQVGSTASMSTLTAGVRPETLTILFDESDASAREVHGTVSDASYFGDMTYYDVMLKGCDEPVTISMRNTVARPVLASGAKVRIGWDADSIILL